MTQRYYEHYFADSPMTELTEAEALAIGFYVTEVAGPPRHFLSYGEGSLSRVIYPVPSPTHELMRSHQETYPGVRATITSPPEHDNDIRRWTTWDYDEGGALHRRVDYVQEPSQTTETWFYGDGSYGGKLERVYDEHGESLLVREHTPDGRVFVHD